MGMNMAQIGQQFVLISSGWNAGGKEVQDVEHVRSME
jgi:hypothetical protein